MNGPEVIRQSFVEDLVKTEAIGKEGEEIRRVVIAERLAQGKKTRVKLTSLDLLRKSGWDTDEIANAFVGCTLTNIRGEEFRVTSEKKEPIEICNIETGQQGYIDYAPRDVPAHKYEYRVSDRNGKLKIITVYDLVFKDNSTETSELIDNLIQAIPAQHFDAIDEIRIDRDNLNVKGVFRDDSGLVGKNIINLYVNSDNPSLKLILETLYHEIGHAIAKALNGNSHPGPKWKKAMDVDGKDISLYSATKRYKNKKSKAQDHGEIEDFAETMKLYLMTD